MATSSVTWKDAGSPPNFAAMALNDTMKVSGKLASVNRVRAHVARSNFEATTGVLKLMQSAKKYTAICHPTLTATVLVTRVL